MEKTDALGRRTWDRATYAALAAERARKVCKDKAKSTEDCKEDKKALRKEKRERLKVKAPKECVWLENRREELNLEKNIGRVVATDDGTAIGFHCELCEFTLKDSQAYLDHLNGKRHNRLKGMSMRVEQKDVNSVREKLKALKEAARRS